MPDRRKIAPRDSKQLIELNQEELTRELAKESYNDLQEGVFKAVIMVGWKSIANKKARNALTSNYTVKQIGKRYYYRIRGMDGSDDQRESLWRGPNDNTPFKIRYSDAVSVIQSHRLAYIEQNVRSKHKPLPGQIWLCRYMRKRYQEPIMLISPTNDDILPTPLIIDDESNIRPNGRLLPPGTYPNENSDEEKPYKFLGEFTYDQAKEVVRLQREYEDGKGLMRIMNFVSKHLGNDNFASSKTLTGDFDPTLGSSDIYDLFNCGYAHNGMNSCTDNIRIIYDKTMNDTFYRMGYSIAIPPQLFVGISKTRLNQILIELDKWNTNIGQSPQRENEKGPFIGQVGRYNFSQVFFKKVMGDTGGRPNFPGFKKNIVGDNFFSQEMQDALVVFALFLQYPVIGGYLVGRHDYSEYAADVLAKIWTVFPAQRSRYEKPPGTFVENGTSGAVRIRKEYSYYYYLNKAKKNGIDVSPDTPGAVLDTTKYKTHIGTGSVITMFMKAAKEFQNFVEKKLKNDHEALYKIFKYPAVGG